MGTFENGDVNSVTYHRFQSKSEHLSKMADGLPGSQLFSSFRAFY